MNKIYKVVWSKVKNCYVVVSEIAKNVISGSVKSAKFGAAPVVKGMTLGALMAFVITGNAWAGVFISSTANGDVDDIYTVGIGSNAGVQLVTLQEMKNSIHDATTVWNQSGYNVILAGDSIQGALIDLDAAVFENANSINSLSVAVATKANAADVENITTTGTVTNVAGDLNVSGNVNARDFSADNIQADTFNELRLESLNSDTSILIGSDNTVAGMASVALGHKVQANSGSVALGYEVQASDGSVAIGNYVMSTGSDSIAIGYNPSVATNGSIALGKYASVVLNGLNGIAIGNSASVSGKNSVALGAMSRADEDNVVSVGYGDGGTANTPVYRRIVNVAEGNLSETSHDAVIGSQLYATNKNIESTVAIVGELATAVAGNTDDIALTMSHVSESRERINVLNESKADKATTLAGYGITDAYTQEEVNAKIEEATSGLSSGTNLTELQNKVQNISNETTVNKTVVTGDVEVSGNVTATTFNGVDLISTFDSKVNAGSTFDSTGLAVGSTSSAVKYAVAVGDGASASGWSVSVGNAASAVGANSIAIGYEARSAYESIAIGYNTYAGASDAIVIGSGAQALPGAIGDSNHGNILIGNRSKADDSYSIAIGDNAEASAYNSLALGANTEATALGSVAIGACSVANEEMVVSVGSGTTYGVYKYRKIINVDAGNISADSHDAVIGSQLFETNQLVSGKADKATTLEGYGITNAYTKSETDGAIVGLESRVIDAYQEADSALENRVADAYKVADIALSGRIDEAQASIAMKANIADVYTKTVADEKFAVKASTLSGYGVADAYTKEEVDANLSSKADKATTLAGYGIIDAYTKSEVNDLLSNSAGGMPVDAYTKTEIDAKLRDFSVIGESSTSIKKQESSFIGSMVADDVDNPSKAAMTYVGFDQDMVDEGVFGINSFVKDGQNKSFRDQTATEIHDAVYLATSDMDGDATQINRTVKTLSSTVSSITSGDKSSTFKQTVDGWTFTVNGESVSISGNDVVVGKNSFSELANKVEMIGSDYLKENDKNQLVGAIANKADVSYVDSSIANVTSAYQMADTAMESQLTQAYQAADSALSGRIDETQASIALKANASEVYTKTEIDASMSNKADKATNLAGYGIDDAYTKSEVDNLLSNSAGGTSVDAYTKTEVEDMLAGKVDVGMVAGSSAVAIGDSSQASGAYSVAIGLESLASNESAIALGDTARATGRKGIAIGREAEARGEHSIAVGVEVNAYGENAIAIGEYASASNDHSVAIGVDSITHADSTVSFGYQKGDKYGENNERIREGDFYRRLTNVADGIDAHDVATVGQLDAKIADATSGLLTNANLIGKADRSYVDAEISYVTNAYKSADTALSNRISDNEKSISALTEEINSIEVGSGTASNKALETKVTNAYKAADTALETKITKGYQAVGNALSVRIAANEKNISTVNTKISSIDKEISSKANKATTLSGYGITDAYTKAEIDKKLKNTASDANMEELNGKTQNISDKTTVGNTVINGDVEVLGNFSAQYATFTQGASFANDSVRIGSDGIVRFGGSDKTANVTIYSTGSTSIDAKGAIVGGSLESKGQVTATGNIISIGGDVKAGDISLKETANALAGKADKADTLSGYGITDAYTKAEVDSKFDGKVDAKDVYTKTDVDSKLADKADKAYVDSTFAKANDVYTKAEADATFVKRTELATIDENGNIVAIASKTELGENFVVEETSSNGSKMTINEGTDNEVAIASDGITIGQHSVRMDSTGFYAGGDKPHTYDSSNSAIHEDGRIKGAGGKFEVATDGSMKVANGKFKVAADGSMKAADGKFVVAADGSVISNDVNISELSMQNAEAVSGLNQRLGKISGRLNKVGAGAAALAALNPLEYDPDDKLNISAGIGNYAGETAAALGAFYRPDEKLMFSLGGTMGNGEDIVNLGVTIGLDGAKGAPKLSRKELIQIVAAMHAESKEIKTENEAIKAENIALEERVAKLEALVAKLAEK